LLLKIALETRMTPEAIERTVRAIRSSGTLVVTAGAGMGVDSGLPDFRGDEGFWKAYPPYRELGVSFVEMANPSWFESDPALAWGFYGHRRHLYRSTRPHRGFEILRRWAERSPGGGHVFTSNVDGHFQKAGFDSQRIIECHGSIEYEQCSANCGEEVWAAPPAPISVDESTMRAMGELPACLRCGGMARPNILMFFDGDWDDRHQQDQFTRIEGWLANQDEPIVVVELGAGTAVPTVRSFSEGMAEDGTLIRINLREPEVPDGQIAIRRGALEALEGIDRALESLDATSKK
jgi:NAD-dependent SIR2 family protein deacetylase